MSRRTLAPTADADGARTTSACPVTNGETLGIVGESGCGKSTLGRCILQLVDAGRGCGLWLGQDLTTLRRTTMRKHAPRSADHLSGSAGLAQSAHDRRRHHRRSAPYPDARTCHGSERRARGDRKMMEAVGLLPEMINRYPHEFSGGQAQRIGIARALITEPKLIVCDEPVSALDVSIQAQILNLLADLKERVRPDADLHQPRPRRRPSCQRPHHGALSRPDRRNGHRRRALSRSEASLHAGAADGGADRRSEKGARAVDRRAGRRSSVADQSALGMRASAPVAPTRSRLAPRVGRRSKILAADDRWPASVGEKSTSLVRRR